METIKKINAKGTEYTLGNTIKLPFAKAEVDGNLYAPSFLVEFMSKVFGTLGTETSDADTIVNFPFNINSGNYIFEPEEDIKDGDYLLIDSCTIAPYILNIGGNEADNIYYVNFKIGFMEIICTATTLGGQTTISLLYIYDQTATPDEPEEPEEPETPTEPEEPMATRGLTKVEFSAHSYAGGNKLWAPSFFSGVANKIVSGAEWTNNEYYFTVNLNDIPFSFIGDSALYPSNEYTQTGNKVEMAFEHISLRGGRVSPSSMTFYGKIHAGEGVYKSIKVQKYESGNVGITIYNTNVES